MNEGARYKVGLSYGMLVLGLSKAGTSKAVLIGHNLVAQHSIPWSRHWSGVKQLEKTSVKVKGYTKVPILVKTARFTTLPNLLAIAGHLPIVELSHPN